MTRETLLLLSLVLGTLYSAAESDDSLAKAQCAAVLAQLSPQSLFGVIGRLLGNDNAMCQELLERARAKRGLFKKIQKARQRMENLRRKLVRKKILDELKKRKNAEQKF